MSKMNHLLDLAHNMPGYEYKWVCAVCLVNAISGVILEYQVLDSDNNLFVVFDSDDTPWVQCKFCYHKFHLHCITCLTVEETLLTGVFFNCCQH